MPPFHRRSAHTDPHISGIAAALLALTLTGCANPGTPRAPSLYMPAPVAVSKMSASRIGSSVEIRFTVPARTTDNLPLHETQLTGSLCRQLETGPCVPVGNKITVPAKAADGEPNIVTWRDELPAELASGSPHILGYRVEFFSPTGISGGKSEPTIAAAGHAPPAVEGLTTEGSRAGIVLRWKPASEGEVLIRREDLAAAAKTPASRNHPEPGVTWLTTDASSPDRVLDNTALPDVAYRYTAQRRNKVQINGRDLELRSGLSAPLNFTLREIYAPSAPTGLTAVGFVTAASPFAVDLIWQPVNERAVMSYNVYREPIDANGKELAPRTLINTEKVTLPGFHDATANADSRYRYEVTAVDGHSNESTAATTVLEPAPH